MKATAGLIWAIPIWIYNIGWSVGRSATMDRGGTLLLFIGYTRIKIDYHEKKIVLDMIKVANGDRLMGKSDKKTHKIAAAAFWG